MHRYDEKWHDDSIEQGIVKADEIKDLFGCMRLFIVAEAHFFFFSLKQRKIEEPNEVALETCSVHQLHSVCGRDQNDILCERRIIEVKDDSFKDKVVEADVVYYIFQDLPIFLGVLLATRVGTTVELEQRKWLNQTCPEPSTVRLPGI